MSACPVGLLQLYIDGELSGSEAIALETHLVDCPSCAREYEGLRSVVDSVRGARPLYDVPHGGRSGIEAMLAAHRRRRVRHYSVMAASACAVAASAVLLFNLAGRGAQFARFAALAAQTHQRYAGGVLTLDYHSDSGPAVSVWLRERLPFDVVLPAHPASPGGRKAYDLVGARILPFGGHGLAFVAYRLNGKPISLLIGDSGVVKPSGGRVLRSGALDFHAVEHDRLTMLAWSDHGITYALVCDVEASAIESCVICHPSGRSPVLTNPEPVPPGRLSPPRDF